MQKNSIRLGVNIDHVATIRNARGGMHPDPVRAAILAAEAGADGITAHLREDRRHISDRDIFRLKEEISLPLNLEMATTQEMLDIALKTRPHAACIVPEKRQEVTTEGGLDVIGQKSLITSYVRKLKGAGIRVSLFVDPAKEQLDAAKECDADIVELHTGKYCELHGNDKLVELNKLVAAAAYTTHLGLECHAGHGLSYQTVMPVASIPEIVELNIGHFLIGEAIFVGLEEAIQEMRNMMDYARNIKGNTGL